MPILNHQSGIYAIICKINNKVYIGQTKSTTTRWRQHKSDLKGGRSRNNRLQHDFNSYGLDAFEYKILENCPLKDRNEREQYWVNYYNSNNEDYGYNYQSGGFKGFKISEKTKLQMIKRLKGKNTWMKGRHHSQESKLKMSESAKGRKVSDNTKIKMSIAKNGKLHTKESKKKISESKKGHFVSEEARLKISQKNKGRNLMKETRERMSNAKMGNKSNKGKILSEEHKYNISKSLKGIPKKPFTEEHRRKLSEAAKGRIPWNKNIQIKGDL